MIVSLISEDDPSTFDGSSNRVCLYRGPGNGSGAAALALLHH
jgi:hypothetical protein